MKLAVCIQCGTIKKLPWHKCRKCGCDPSPDRLACAKSIILSTAYGRYEDEKALTVEQLIRISTDIKNGKPFVFDEPKIRALLEERKNLDLTFWR